MKAWTWVTDRSTLSFESGLSVQSGHSDFFPRVRTPCGHGAQVIVEGKETLHYEGERTQATQNSNKPPTQPKNHQPKSQPGQRPIPPHSKCFLCTRVRQVKKAKPDCELTMGLNSLRKSVGMVSAKAECSGACQRGLAPPTKL